MSETRPSGSYYVVKLKESGNEKPDNDFGPLTNQYELIEWSRKKIEEFQNVCSNVPAPIPIGGSTFLINLSSEEDKAKFDGLYLKPFDPDDDAFNGSNIFPDGPLRRRAWLYYLDRNIAASSIGLSDDQKQWRKDLTELLEEKGRELDGTPEAKHWKSLLAEITSLAPVMVFTMMGVVLREFSNIH